MYKFSLLILYLFFLPFNNGNSATRINLLTASKLTLPNSVKIVITTDLVYHTQKTYQAYPLNKIIKKLGLSPSNPSENYVLIFTAADGYKVTMAYQDALVEKGYLAFKDLSVKKASWNKFKFGNEYINPGPYYLIWPKADLDKWRYPSPFQLISISIQTSESYFFNAAPVSNSEKVKHGFALFSRYCIRCHSVNYTGGNLGPELNLPKNITDFYTTDKLTDFILDASLFSPQTKMPRFKSILSPTDVLKIQRYLKSMKKK